MNYDRQYKALKMTNQNSIQYIKEITDKHYKCCNLMKPLSIYVRNKVINPTPEARKDLDEYNGNPSLKWIGLEKINLDNTELYENNIMQVSGMLNVTKDNIIKFLLTNDYKFIHNLAQVSSEQYTYAHNEPYYNNSWYLEIYGSNRILSMFVSNIPIIKIQLHHFILSDIKNLIENKNSLSNSSLFMHSFASSLFGNNAWYTTPIGNMQGILEYKLKVQSYTRTPQDEFNDLSKYINKLWTNPPVQPTIKYIIGDFWKNLWKTKDSIKHDAEHNKEQLGHIYDPIIIIYTIDIIHYAFNYNMVGGSYYNKYAKYKSKYLHLDKNNN